MRSRAAAAAFSALLLCTTGFAGQSDVAAPVSPGQAQGSDTLLVRAILDSIGWDTVAAASVSKTVAGRVVGLTLAVPLGGEAITQLPATVGMLTELEELTVTKCVLTSLPAAVRTLKKLRVLDLGYNEITMLPAWIGELTKLERLDLRYNELSSLPASLYTLSRLRFLQLWGNSITQLSEDIGRLTGLEELYVQRNRLTTLPVAITRMSSLKYIDYGYNRLCDPAPQVHEWLVKRDKKYRQLQNCR